MKEYENEKKERGINKFQAPKIDYEINLINACANILESSQDLNTRTLADEVAYSTLLKVHSFINPGVTPPKRLEEMPLTPVVSEQRRHGDSGY
ncbi:MAG: hypothetical protein E6R13_10235 [Spirochaetes bacterium]|nr:MAG: hypothetical protein E6R13_10235 [Spirochaetota bacterium]